MIESPTTFGHVAGLLVVDPSTACGDAWDLIGYLHDALAELVVLSRAT